MDTAEVLLHPVRLRIVHAMAGGEMTTAELCERIPDASKATIYRHVGALADASVLEVAWEQRVRGVVEKRYRLRRDRAVIDAERAASTTVDEHRAAFPVAMAVLLAEFAAYLDRPDADPAGDLVGYRQHSVWLSDDEKAALIEDLREVLLPRLTQAPAPGRRQHLLSPILFPTRQ
ncbi:helix-turn-helix domain-containing protein [Dactylosporangium sp. AC04546]|uniref:helix-turn-helix domain-containing protein n=1 Tax=Dactylosporangium sp. AC04546 TaxID=2862460 RepID=UPI001EDF5DCC|nr:helix-turn-helix domain-containing protein [Dactylosporangium sp. AC04546]WVK88006.1 helix-turn-helix domain-containing protein [Dactylosporangium sp. AC04546]